MVYIFAIAKPSINIRLDVSGVLSGKTHSSLRDISAKMLMVMMWKEGTIGQEYSREYETENQDNNYESVKDTLENISDENPQVSGNIFPRMLPIMEISTVDMLDESSDNEKMHANCCVL